ncbi:MAG: PASTA domain-containing protein [Deltaproteobacteria bacterium]|nr:PASTA domain-containing protein [Deltaproteobacteria bacterium]
MAERAIDGVVKAGSADNRFTIAVTNPSRETSAGEVSLNIAAGSQWMTNLRIEADKKGDLPPGATCVFTITFDVLEGAQAESIETVVFKVSADMGLIDTPNPEMTVKIEKETKEDEQIASPPILKLVRITGPSSTGAVHSGEILYNHTENQSGYTARIVSAGKTVSVLGVAVTYAPLEIIPGKPFRIEAEARQNVFTENPPDCGRERTRPAEASPYWVKRGYGGAGIFAPGISIEASLLQGWARSRDPLGCGNGIVKLTVLFVPEKHALNSVMKQWESYYTWRVESDGRDAHGTNNLGYGAESKPRRLFSYSENNRTNKLDIEVLPRKEDSFTAPLILQYRTLEPGQTAMAKLPPFDFPPELIPSPGETAVGDSKGSARPDQTDPGFAKPVHPERLNPAKENMSAIIREWVSVAEPPENATEGAKLRYDPWGRKTGTTADGDILTATSRPDYALASPEETVWSVRQRLDSVDHCTLEEYVLGKLNNRSMENCRGRYKAPETVTVANMTGFPLSDAKKKLEQDGLKSRLVAGKAALSKSDEGKIASQDPGPGAKLKRGSGVKLEVYGPYRPEIFVPDIAGLTAREAKAQIEAQGLKARLVALGPAPSEDLSFRAREAEPKAGSKVAPGTEVTVKVYGQYSLPLAVVPAVEGLSFSDAKARLASAGLKVSPLSAGPAPSEEKSSRVKSQEPGAGGKVAPGSEVKLFVFSKYVPRDQPVVERPPMESSHCSQAPGVWQWHNGWTVHVCAEKKLMVARQGNRIRSGGGWGCSERNGQAHVTMYWHTENGREFLTISGNRFTGKDERGGSISGVKVNGVPDCRDPVDGRESDCDLGGRFENRSMALEFTTGDGINYEGRLLRVDDFYLKDGYRPGMVYFKVTRIGPNEFFGGEYTGQRMRLTKTSQGRLIAKWDKVALLSARCGAIQYTGEDISHWLTVLKRVR